MNWTENVRARLTDVNIQESLRVASRSVLGEMGPRIFDKGLTPQGSSIGTYSTRPLVMQKTDMRKTGGGEPAGAKARYFSGGYRQYKESLGDGSNFNMRNFGVMMRDFYSPQERLRGKELTLTFKQKRSADIINGDPRMQKALGMSPAERAVFEREFQFEFQKRVFPS